MKSIIERRLTQYYYMLACVRVIVGEWSTYWLVSLVSALISESLLVGPGEISVP